MNRELHRACPSNISNNVGQSRVDVVESGQKRIGILGIRHSRYRDRIINVYDEALTLRNRNRRIWRDRYERDFVPVLEIKVSPPTVPFNIFLWRWENGKFKLKLGELQSLRIYRGTSCQLYLWELQRVFLLLETKCWEQHSSLGCNCNTWGSGIVGSMKTKLWRR